MKVSVIIPVYNMEKYLRMCLDSVLGQSLTDFEAVCIDDCSTDRSADILKEYEQKDSRIHVVTNKKNGGLSYARNQGLKKAGGDYILFLDSDDMLAPDALWELYHKAQQNRTDIIFFDSEMLIESDKVSEEESAYCTMGEYDGVMSGVDFLGKMQCVGDIRIPACLQFWNRERFHELKMEFFDGLFHEDILFTYLGLMRTKRVMCIRKPYYIYRRHDDSITLRKISIDYIKSLLVIYHEIVNYWYSHKEDSIDEVTQKYLTDVQWSLNKYAAELGMTVDEMKQALGGRSIYGYWYDILAERSVEIKHESGIAVDKLIQMAKARRAYVYGAGMVARRYIPILQKYGIEITGIIVSDVAHNPEYLFDIPVYGIEALLPYKEDCAVLIGVGKKLREEVVTTLQNLGVRNIVEFY